ncbi:MAG: transcription elongation factor GreB [Nevskia sp.]|nr:transcription elongation factor GreB [Nevskia sp.]
MSRAFVKEPQADAPEDLPELPLSPNPNYVTPRGLALLQQRKTAAEQSLAEIRADSIGGKQQRAQLERELRWLQSRIGTALLVDPATRDSGRVALGAEVLIADSDGAEHRYRIVGEDEADPEQGLISWTSPLARALIGTEPGDIVSWQRPAGDLEVEVLTIRYDGH